VSLKSKTVGAIGALARRAGYYAEKRTDPSQVRALIERLHPLATEHPLIRMGPEGDGGYLLPADLDDMEACFSPGVALISGFESGCAAQGMEVFMADASVDGPSAHHDRFHFTKKYIGARTSDDIMTMDQWVNASLPGSGRDLLLQIDIEGAEYETFLNMSDDLLARFRVIVAEFHHLADLFNPLFFNLAVATFDRILQTHFCVHIHPNNCCGMVTCDDISVPRVAEFTFLRRDRSVSTSFATAFPHDLDRDNTENAPMPLPPIWYQ